MSTVAREMTAEEWMRMIAEERELNPERPIRPDIKNALDNYAFSGFRLGNFLSAVVENDLFEALGRADAYNRATIYQIVQYIYNELPSTCWGSKEIVEAHYKSFRGNYENASG